MLDNVLLMHLFCSVYDFNNFRLLHLWIFWYMNCKSPEYVFWILHIKDVIFILLIMNLPCHSFLSFFLVSIQYTYTLHRINWNKQHWQSFSNFWQYFHVCYSFYQQIVYYSIGFKELTAKFWHQINKSRGGVLLIRCKILMHVHTVQNFLYVFY